MIFTSLEFLVFFFIVLAVRWRIRNQNVEKWFLLIASWLFYMTWNAPCVLILIGITTSDYFIGKYLNRLESAKPRRLLMGLSLAIDLGVLCFFKYANFMTGTWRSVLSLAGVDSDPVFLEIILPVGISFFVFHSLSYTFDIYRRRIVPAPSWRDYSLFVAFFPPQIAGPIVRAADFLPQLLVRTRPSPEMFESGLASFLLGAVKKSVLSDQIAAQVDMVFAAPGQFDAPSLMLALLGFTAQIYLDFSGYSDMAIGSARMLGYELNDNFRMPYASASITEFWHRWHISLSTWLRDYVYISFGGNRHGKSRTYLNLLATMLLGGLWHGASWNFVIWGGLHGVGLCIHKAWCAFLGSEPSQKPTNMAASVAGWMMTLVFVCFAWILFRCVNFTDSISFASRLLSLRLDGVRSLPPQILIVLGVVGLAHFLWNKDVSWYREIPNRSFAARLLTYSVLLSLIVVFGVSQAAPFIYFQF